MKKRQRSRQVFAEVAGWYGTVAILAAYAFVSFGFISGEGLVFQLLNLTGAVGIIVIASYKHIVQSVVLNVVWSIVALIAIASIIF